MDEVIRWLGTFTLILGTLSFVIFVIMYGTMSDWRATVIGRYIFVFFGLIATVFAYVVFITVIPLELSVTTRLVIRLAVFGSFAVAGWWLVWILLRIQIRERRERDALVRSGEVDGSES